MYLLSHGAVKVGRVVYSDELIDGFCRRRGEEHSFILKPASSMWKGLKTYGEKSKSSSLQLPSKTFNRKGSASTVNQYAIMVSCRCNYTGMYISLSLHYHVANFVLIKCSNYEHINFYVKCRVKIVFQAANQLETTCFKGSYDLSHI